ncbi:hypothetical protein [Lacrimispora sp.]|uniref:hypothetical protein n=1 Tax=Lacrimispora sp. TaxID=2719234 RepID=UPI002FD8B085
METVKSIYLRNIYEEIMKRKTFFLIFVLIFTALFAVVGYKNGINANQNSEEQQKSVQAYQKNITDYEDTISEMNKSLILAQEQIDQLQSYVDKSIYMHLDSQNIRAASAQFAVLNSGNAGNVLTSLSYYVNEGGLLEELSDKYGSEHIQYLKEVIMSSIGGNILNITVYHYDAEQAQKLLELIENGINKQATQIAKVQGDFTIQKISSSNYLKADIAVSNTQNSHLNNLKNFLSNKVDLENKRIAQENGKNSYIEKNASKMAAIIQVNPLKMGIKFAAVGSVFGFLLLWLYHSMRYILGDKLKSKEDLISSNLLVIGNYNVKKGHLPALDKSIMDIQLWVEQYQMAKIFINVLSEDEIAKSVVKDYIEEIDQINLPLNVGYHVSNDVEELRSMISAKYCIMIVQVGKTSYSDINEQIATCKKFGLKVLGYVVVD